MSLSRWRWLPWLIALVLWIVNLVVIAAVYLTSR